MVLLYEEIWESPTPKTHAPPQYIPGVKKQYSSGVKKFSPDVTSFLAGLVTGFIILPIALPIIGFQVSKRWGAPPPPPRRK